MKQIAILCAAAMSAAVCDAASAFGDCWRLTPKAEQAGKSYRLVLNAWDDTGLVAAGTTTVVVARAPTEAEKGRRITLALLGASSTNCRYPDQILRRMREAGFAGLHPHLPRRERHLERTSRRRHGEVGDTLFAWLLNSIEGNVR